MGLGNYATGRMLKQSWLSEEMFLRTQRHDNIPDPYPITKFGRTLHDVPWKFAARATSGFREVIFFHFERFSGGACWGNFMLKGAAKGLGLLHPIEFDPENRWRE